MTTQANTTATEQTKHTPGPWHIGDTNTNFSPKVYGADGYMTADCSRIQKRTDAEEQANARLIAAAPDLLAALKSVVAIADRKTVEFDNARAAIAAAEGK